MDASSITALFAGLVTLLSAVVAAIVTLTKKTVNEIKVDAKNTAAINSVKLEEIHVLTNSALQAEKDRVAKYEKLFEESNALNLRMQSHIDHLESQKVPEIETQNDHEG